MRVMGVDPGLTRCGLSVVESGGGRKIIALDVDVVRTPADEPLQRRLLAISDTVDHWMDTHLPDVVAIERVFANQNANTAMGTAQAGGVIALAAAKRNIDVHFHTPSEVKAAVTGNGRADKAQVTTMVTRILGLQAKPTPADAADALALAICHCWRAPMIARMAAAEAMAAEQRRKYTGQGQGRPMIASVRGEVLDIALDHVVIEAAGVGYKLMAAPSTLATLRRGSEARLITAMIVREDSMTLYGFPDGDARDLFLTLLGVSGIGPKIALATLAVYDATSLRQALADGDVTALTRVPGIGKRGAERLVLELRDKIGPVAAGGSSAPFNGHSVRGPVVEALVGLGFAAKQAEEATDKVLAADEEATTSTALRSALSLLGKTK